MKNIMFFLFSCFLVLASCYHEDENNSVDNSSKSKFKKENGLINCITVAPSGDTSGETDANNIEDALNDVKSIGGVVCLTDGNDKTIDKYYTSRNIVVQGFNGSLLGESKDNTLIFAGRKSESIGFEPAYSPIWTLFYGIDVPTIFQFDNATGDVVISDLAILVIDDQPTDPIPAIWNPSVTTTYIWTFIEIIGGVHNTVIENVRLEGKETSADGNVNGMNAGYGIHVMPWIAPPFPPVGTKGNLSVKNVNVENNSWEAVSLMDFNQNSNIDIDNIRAINVGGALHVRRIYNSSVNISNMDVEVHNGARIGFRFADVDANVQFMNNSIEGSLALFGLSLFNVKGAMISENKFINIGDALGIIVANGSNDNSLHHNDFKKSSLPGWNNGSGALLITPDSFNNNIFEMKFPPSQGKALCDMILDETDNPSTAEYDGLNEIHNWIPCENLTRMNLIKFESEPKSRIPNFNN